MSKELDFWMKDKVFPPPPPSLPPSRIARSTTRSTTRGPGGGCGCIMGTQLYTFYSSVYVLQLSLLLVYCSRPGLRPAVLQLEHVRQTRPGPQNRAQSTK